MTATLRHTLLSFRDLLATGHVPLSYADELCSRRSHIQMVGNGLRADEYPAEAHP
jgi:hypothetical protein